MKRLLRRSITVKVPVEELVALYKKMDYENLDDFANAVAGSIKYKMGAEH